MATTDDQGRMLGNEEILYVSSTSPTVATDPTDYTKVGLLVNNPFSGDSAEVEANDKDSDRFSSSLPGTGSYDVDVEAHRPASLDSGQEIVRDAWINGDEVYWLISTNTSGEECKHGRAAVTSYGEPSSTDEYATMTATLSGQGAPTFEAVP